LEPRISDEQAVRRLDRKRMVIDTSKIDEIFFKVEDGKVDIKIEAEKKKYKPNLFKCHVNGVLCVGRAMI
jgi:hypothetical protein